MKLIMLLLLAALVSACNSSSAPQDLEPAQSLESLKKLNNLPALATAKIINGEMEFNVAGVKRIGTDSPMTSNDSFHLGSCSKAMTATLAAILIEEGKLDWDSKLVDLLPDINLHPDFADATFEMLLSHRTGLINDGRDTFPNDWLYTVLKNPALSTVDAKILYAKNVLTLKPQATPGSKFIYSNGGYIIAAHIMEVLTGLSWETLIQEKLFDPLAMNTCGTGPTWGHYRSGTSIISIKADNPPAYSPAAGIHCSMEDWGKFLLEHLRGLKNESGIVSAESFHKLHTFASNDGHDYTFGGWGKGQRDWSGGPVLTHNGTNGWNYAQVWIAPAENAIYMVATNIGGRAAEIAMYEALAGMLK